MGTISYNKNNKCIDCGKSLSSCYALRCVDCSVIARIKPKNKCVDCGKEINGGYKRCHSCACKYNWKTSKKLKNLNRFGKNNGMFGKQHTKETKRKICLKTQKQFQNGMPKKTKDKISRTLKNKYRDINYKNNVLKSQRKGMKLSPNKPEKLLNSLLQQILPKEYKYNKTLSIAGLIPDFVNKNNNKIIEMYGDYWHKRPEVLKRDKRRKIAYKKYGYKTLIIWEHELKNLDEVKDKIKEFNKIGDFGYGNI